MTATEPLCHEDLIRQLAADNPTLTDDELQLLATIALLASDDPGDD